MTKPVAHYLLSFLAGSIATLGFVAASGHGIWSGHPSGVAGLSAFKDTGLPLGAVALAVAGFAVLVVAAVGLHGSLRAGTLGRRVRPRAGLADAHSPAGAKEQPVAGGEEVAAVRNELERQLGRLIVLIAGQLEKSQDHVASLKTANAHLGQVTSVAELRDVVRSLISSNDTNERQTRDLEARLQEAQEQASVLRQRLTQAEKLAALDPLTSVANRRRFEQFISTEVDKSHASGTPLCLIMADIDHFKTVNDKHGHAAGDRVLKAFADLLSVNVRQHDLVARYGGEEFALVLPQTPMGDAFAIAERIRCMLELYGGPDATLVKEFGRLTASFGVAEIRDGEPPSALIQRTDLVLYEAKSNGRNRTMTCSLPTAMA